MFGSLFVVFPAAYLPNEGVKVRIEKSPGGLNEDGFRIFVILMTRATSEAMAPVLVGKVIFIVVALTNPHTRLPFTNGADILH